MELNTNVWFGSIINSAALTDTWVTRRWTTAVVVLSRSYDSATLRELTPLVISVVDWVDFSVARKPLYMLLSSFCIFVD